MTTGMPAGRWDGNGPLLDGRCSAERRSLRAQNGWCALAMIARSARLAG